MNAREAGEAFYVMTNDGPNVQFKERNITSIDKLDMKPSEY